MKDFKEFINYVFDYYGAGGMYSQNRTKEQISYALLLYLDRCNDAMDQWDWGTVTV